MVQFHFLRRALLRVGELDDTVLSGPNLSFDPDVTPLGGEGTLG
jgi:hypothetical protein